MVDPLPRGAASKLALPLALLKPNMLLPLVFLGGDKDAPPRWSLMSPITSYSLVFRQLNRHQIGAESQIPPQNQIYRCQVLQTLRSWSNWGTSNYLHSYINSADQIADVLTKALPRDKFQRMKDLLGLTNTAVHSLSSSRVGSVVGTIYGWVYGMRIWLYECMASQQESPSCPFVMIQISA